MATDTLTSIDNLDQELTELRTELQASLDLLAALNKIPEEFVPLRGQLAAMSEATDKAETQAVALAAAGAEQDRKFAQMTEELSARTSQLGAEWQAFRDAARREQNQLSETVTETHQALVNRAGEQEKLVASLDERLETMNRSLANMITDLGAARRDQARLALLLAVIILLSLGLSAAALWYALQ